MAGSVSVSYPVGLPDRTARAALALGAVGYAYMDALARSDWANATPLLGLFQELFNENRSATLIGFASADQLAASQQIPRSLSIDGRFGPNTRTAMVAAMVSGFLPYTADGVPMASPVPPSVADSMPGEAAALGRWFTSTLAPRISGTRSARFARNIAAVAGSADFGQAAQDVRGAIEPFILGGASATSGPTAVQDANAQARSIVEQSGGTQTTRAVEYGAGVDNPTGGPLATILGPATYITAQTPKVFPDWGWYAAAAGILGLGGILAYMNVQKRRR
jgi:hypothetical protein